MPSRCIRVSVIDQEYTFKKKYGFMNMALCKIIEMDSRVNVVDSFGEVSEF